MDKYVFAFEGEGIECVYDNGKWVACIKNWKPNNDIESIERLEVHHESDEQFILYAGTTDKNSEYCYFTEEQKNRIYKEAKNFWK